MCGGGGLGGGGRCFGLDSPGLAWTRGGRRAGGGRGMSDVSLI